MQQGPPPWMPGSAMPPQADLPTPAPQVPKGSCSLSRLWVWLLQWKTTFRSVLLLSWKQPFPGVEAHSVLRPAGLLLPRGQPGGSLWLMLRPAAHTTRCL